MIKMIYKLIMAAGLEWSVPLDNTAHGMAGNRVGTAGRQAAC